YGETRSYGEIARQIGSPGAFRAVGLANGHNPIGIIVPCHRVIGSNGSLTGYGGGIDRKRALLELEKSRTAPGLFDPAIQRNDQNLWMSLGEGREKAHLPWG
ncbi:MAG: methylated-DNA-[protein]-cysteine S-methyltransferase, partial [Mycobacterium sp.]|nr:methylated-DNA-[protein]-cysteine S-methyltransferase [Mycobacterium sp.]